MSRDERSTSRPWYLDPAKLAFLGFLGIAAYFLITEHWAHVVPWLPYLFLLACPLLHIFMHRGHGGHSGHGGHGGEGGHAGHRPIGSGESQTPPKPIGSPDSQGSLSSNAGAKGKDQPQGGDHK